MLSLVKMPLNIKSLKKDLPHWEWKAVKNNFGCIYEGTKADKQVTIYAVSVWSGWGDHYETEWRVELGETSMPYAGFWLKERIG
jgi:hypothetical protein